MKNFVAPGEVLTLTAPSGGVVSGSPYLVGSIFGVAAVTAAQATPFEIVTEGVFNLPKTTGTAWVAGDALYWVVSTSKLDKAASGNSFVGFAAADAASADATGDVKLSEQLPIPAHAAITDTSAITGGEAPTEAEFNALQVKVNGILAALRSAGIVA